MNTREEEFLKTLRATFKVEAEEHLHAMSSGLLELEKAPGAAAPTTLIETIYREAHSLKGAARAVNLLEIERICQSLETVFAAWKRGELSPSPEHFDTLHRVLDYVSQFLNSAESEEPRTDYQQITNLIEQLTDIQPQQRCANGHEPDNQFSRPLVVVNSKPVEEKIEQPKIYPLSPANVKVEAAPSPAIAPEQSATPDTVRISTAKLDKLLLEAEEMLAVKMTAAQRAVDLRDVRSVFGQWNKEWARLDPQFSELRNAERRTKSANGSNGDMQRHASHAPSALLEFLDWNHAFLKSLENKLASFGKSLERDQHSIGKIVDDLLDDSKRLLMLPFSTLLSAFPKLVRDLSRDQGKKVEMVIRGGEVEIDKRILEEMKDPLIHLIRNCVDHGIEKPELRAEHDKPARATITIAVSQVDGNKVEILLSDDGAGIELEKVKASAVKHGIISADEARKVSRDEALALIFQSDVSTSPIITELSGRGLGLAIVREKVEKLGGRLTVESNLAVGTTFRIHVPLTIATFRGILVKAADQIFVIPTASVERAERVHRDEIKTVGNKETVSLNNRAVSLARLDAVLDLPRNNKNGDNPKFVPMVVLGSAEKQIAFGVDEILYEEEVLVKRLGKPLSRVRNISGATVLGSGKPVPILNVADLMKSALKVGGTLPKAVVAGGNSEAKQKSILVAEDSITSRMLIKGILESAGYRVTTTVDGMEALTTLKTEEFDAVVSDVEMPRMTGFELTASIRGDKRLADKPVVLVTALASREHRERGIEVGANAYIVKSNFDQSNLLEALQRLV